MTVLEVLGSCVQRIREIRLPVAEAVNTLQLTGIADDIQACIDTLAAHADHGAVPEDKAKPEESGKTERTEEAQNEENDLFGEKAGGENDERTDV
jgi:hypothetical protein